jgi:hypothetical protein
MKSLKITLFIVFVALSLVISFGVGMVIYAQYTGYIKDTYEGTLKQVLEGVAEHFPLLSDPDYIVREGQAQSEVFTNLSIELQKITKMFNVEDIVLFDRQQPNTYRFLVGVFQEGDPLALLANGDFLAPFEAGESAVKAIETAKAI